MRLGRLWLWLQWLWRAAPSIGAIAIALVPPAGWLRDTDAAEGNWFLWSGLAIQLAGFALVWWELNQSMREHGHPGLMPRARDWWQTRPGHGRTIHVSAADAIGLGGHARLRVRKGRGDESVEARLQALEANFASMQADVDGEMEELRRDAAALRRELKVEREARQSATQALEKKLQAVVVGGVGMELAGLLWFVTGCIFSTLAPWLSTC